MPDFIRELLAHYGGWIGTALVGLGLYYFLVLSWDDNGNGSGGDGRGK